MATDDQGSELQEELFDTAEQETEDERPSLSVPEKDRKLVTHPYDFIVRSLHDQIKDGTLMLADKFQRRRVWDDTKASRLIESLLLNVPIPVCYFAEFDNSTYSVIDGQQRLTAIYRFLDNEFALRGLRVRPDLVKKRFFELSDADRRLILSRSIRCIVLLKESHADIRFDVFERLNTGSVRLNAQELRNSMYRGALNDLLRELSEFPAFQQARGVTAVDKRMQDCEMVLRFFAFHFRLQKYRGYFSAFLDEYLQSGMKFSPAQIDEHRAAFEKTISGVCEVFGGNAFRRRSKKGEWEGGVNRALYDCVMLTFARLDLIELEGKGSELADAMGRLCANRDFSDSVTFATKDKSKLQTRLGMFRQALVSLGVNVPELKVGA